MIKCFIRTILKNYLFFKPISVITNNLSELNPISYENVSSFNVELNLSPEISIL